MLHAASTETAIPPSGPCDKGGNLRNNIGRATCRIRHAIKTHHDRRFDLLGACNEQAVLANLPLSGMLSWEGGTLTDAFGMPNGLTRIGQHIPFTYELSSTGLHDSTPSNEK